MTKQTMIRNYRKYSAADEYIVGFVVDKMLYFVSMKHIAPRFLNVEQASRNQGDNLRLRLKKNQKLSLMKKAICVGTESDLISDNYNKGENFERIITEYYGQKWEKDTVPFYVAGDINLNGKEVQIKLDSATLINEKLLKKLQKKS